MAIATHKAMEEVSGPVVAIAIVLSAVFVPVAFLGGITGQLYKQFALTIAASVVISSVNALTLSPALCALLLKKPAPGRGLLALRECVLVDQVGPRAPRYGLLPPLCRDARVEEPELPVQVGTVLCEAREQQERVRHLVLREGEHELVVEQREGLALACRVRRAEESAHHVEVAAVTGRPHTAGRRDIEVAHRDDDVLDRRRAGREDLVEATAEVRVLDDARRVR